MPNNVDVGKMLEERAKKVDKALDSMTPGSTGYSTSVGDLCALARELTELKKAEADAADKEEKRVEQQRMNDNEIEFKQTQLEIEAARAMNEKERGNRQTKTDLMKIGVQSAVDTFCAIGYFGMSNRAMNHEYNLTGGASVQPPTGLVRMLDNFKPRRR